MSVISDQLQKINNTLKPTTKLIAVSKTKPEAMIREAYACGQRDFGENKVQDLLEKSENLSDLTGIRWHFIGSLQTNKINNLLKVKNLVSIHSIDSLKLLQKLLSKSIESKLGIFLQVNTSGESEKSGFSKLSELQACHSIFKDSGHFYLQGLMTIGKIRTDEFEADAKSCFDQLAQLKEQLDEENLELSMGMSADYLIAQDCGSSWIRVGSQVFGGR
jgi:pyridoxal phosphate enzyme (YggS family)